jgi:hypothetical protein
VESKAAAAFARVDDAIRSGFPPDQPQYEYTGYTQDVVGVDNRSHVRGGKYQQDSADALVYADQLEQVVEQFRAPDWQAAAIARQATLYDDLWRALRDAGPPRVAYFTPKQEALLQQLAATGPGSIQRLQSQAADLRATAKEGWEKTKQGMLDETAAVIVGLDATSVAIARQYRVASPQIAHALQRLAFFRTQLGEAKMRQAVNGTKDPRDPTGQTNLVYSEGMYP